MKKITDFFWFCSGAHVELLKKYPTEHNKFIGIGATIFFTALFASLSGGYAMYFVFAGNTAAPIFAIVFGLLWGLAIFNMDRYIVASIKKTGSSNHQIMQALPRILLAIMIGIVISRPLELKIFDKEIRQKLKTSYLNGQRDKIDTLNKAFSNKYQLELKKLDELKTEKDSLEKDINRSRYILNQEVFGDKTNQTSGVIGFGTYAKQKQSIIDQKEQRLQQVRGQLQSSEDLVNRRKELEGLNSTRLFNERELDSLANVAGFADRNYALGQLSFNPDGTRDVDTYLAISFISFLFILLECLPVFVKLMSDKGPYDIALEHEESIAIYKSERNKDHEIMVTDDIQGTLNDTETSKRKTFIERRAKRDLEDFEY
ncbi:hypothetical protein Pedsa_3556 [Pseudopedobacter saltans DSM 12145]|uniref:DUF4407 domain-containing protein n=1 Tax=Pseudopedobacter saltans (strain ATCC 51119 / DSM 12145 / JCM 21818 / CCUG 39354 / LMG 10337 / NBRC 100064 / NCIMB 13643) TaxID=762903 RepID=F0SF18_PSESL|nr:DUF4407 domain-containing protein [Pseudopedobacter saltans]ADY54086.1 hypothetical protein Pedsa_3556 [Pseudopedobacter saltans DSM 12145]